MMTNIVALIPAYNPSEDLLSYVQQLRQHFPYVVIVNDGSKSECQSTFEKLSEIKAVTVLKHAVNCGKGAALKTGLNHIEITYPKAVGVVTIDADGQHRIEDAIKVAQALQKHPDQLIM